MPKAFKPKNQAAKSMYKPSMKVIVKYQKVSFVKIQMKSGTTFTGTSTEGGSTCDGDKKYELQDCKWITWAGGSSPGEVCDGELPHSQGISCFKTNII